MRLLYLREIRKLMNLFIRNNYKHETIIDIISKVTNIEQH